MPKGMFVQDGGVIDYTNGGASAIGYHDVVELATCIGIAAEEIAVGATGSLALTGVWELPAVNDTAFVVGDTLYWDSTAGNLTKVSTDNPVAGKAVAAKTQTGTTANVKIG